MTGLPSLPEAAHFVHGSRLHHILFSICAIHAGDTGSRFGGTPREGMYSHLNFEGDHFVFVWDAAGVVALEHDHEDRSSQFSLKQEERTPERLFAAAPDALAPLIREACGWGERLATGALWACSDSSIASGRGSRNLSERLAAFGLPHEVALFSQKPGWSWAEMAGVSREHALLALELAAASALGPCRVGSREAGILLEPPSDGPPLVKRAYLEAAVGWLRQADVEWPDAEEHLQERERRLGSR